MANGKHGLKQDPKRDAKHDVKATKKVFSTSRIFKNAGKHGSPRTNHDKGKLAGRKPLHEKGLPSRHKRKVTPEHSLAVGFHEAIEDSRTTIQEDSAELVKHTTRDLFDRLDETTDDLAKRIEADNEANEPFFKPLGDEELTFTAKDGSQVGSATLASRIKKFQKFIAKEEQELESLCRQYARVSQEIAAEAEEALGPQWASIIDMTTAGKAAEVGQDGSQELPEDLIEIQTHFEELINEAGQKALEEMEASEKAFKVRQKKDNLRLIELMKDDD